jgi:hypothetical protein
MPDNPKDFFKEKRAEFKQDLCFVLMPFEHKFDSVWEVIQTTAESNPFSLQCLRADQIVRPGYIMEDVLEHIAIASIIIADLTDKNANVFYELGIAHSHKDSSSVLLLSQSMDFIPFDLRNLRCLIYKPDLSDLKTKLTEALRHISPNQYRLNLLEGERKKFPSRISGKDHCLYEVEIQSEYLGDDGVKFTLHLIRFAAGENPQEVYTQGHYLGKKEDLINLPRLNWNLCYGGGDQHEAILLLLPQKS